VDGEDGKESGGRRRKRLALLWSKLTITFGGGRVVFNLKCGCTPSPPFLFLSLSLALLGSGHDPARFCSFHINQQKVLYKFLHQGTDVKPTSSPVGTAGRPARKL
jgi:hypothetical protein